MLINQLVLHTSRLAELKHFYHDILGLSLVPGSNAEICIQAGSTELVFAQAGKGEPVYHFAFNIPSNRIAGARDWLKEKVELLWIEDYAGDIADFVNWHAKSVYFYDPAGNIVECIARFDLDNKSDGPFSAAHFLSVSEVGIVFPKDSFDSETAELLSRYELSYFSKQPPLPQFRAVGDDEGLFIIVPEHRNWYPTFTPSGIFPIQVRFSEKGKDLLLRY